VRRLRHPRCVLDVGGHQAEPFGDDLSVQRLIAVMTEHGRKELRLNPAEQHVAIGDCQRAAAAIRSRPGVRSCRFRADAQTHAIELTDRPAPRRDRVDLHQRCPQSNPRNFGVECALVFSCVVRDIRGSPAHVEADDLANPRLLRGARRTDDAARRAGKDRVLALELLSIGETAGRLHELQLHAGQLRGNLIHVAPQNGRQVRIDNRRVAACDQLHQRADLMRDRDLDEADAARELFELLLVLRIPIAMQQCDRARADAAIESGPQIPLGLLQIRRAHDVAMRANAFVDFDDLLVQHRWQLDVSHEQLGTMLITDAQCVGESAGDRQHGAIALAFEQRVGRYRGAHPHDVDGPGWDGLLADAEQLPYALHGRVAVALRVFRQELERHERAVGLAADDIRERAAAIDPELPARGHMRRRAEARPASPTYLESRLETASA
jgi:hypothetical protein